jgi:hypothetical protein
MAGETTAGPEAGQPAPPWGACHAGSVGSHGWGVWPRRTLAGGEHPDRTSANNAGCDDTAVECGICGVAATWFSGNARECAPRERPDQRKRARGRFPRYPGGLGTHQGRDTGTHQGRDQGSAWGTDPGTGSPTKQFPKRCTGAVGNSECELRATVTVQGPGSASARPGPCTRPRSADALTRREYHPARQTPASRSFVLGRRSPASWDGPRRAGGLRALHLDPGSGRMGSRGHGSGVPPSAQRHLPGEALARRLTSICDDPFCSGCRVVGVTTRCAAGTPPGWRDDPILARDEPLDAY